MNEAAQKVIAFTIANIIGFSLLAYVGLLDDLIIRLWRVAS